MDLRESETSLPIGSRIVCRPIALAAWSTTRWQGSHSIQQGEGIWLLRAIHRDVVGIEGPELLQQPLKGCSVEIGRRH